MSVSYRNGVGIRFLRGPPDKREVGSSTLPRPIFLYFMPRLDLRSRWGIAFRRSDCLLSVAAVGCPSYEAWLPRWRVLSPARSCSVVCFWYRTTEAEVFHPPRTINCLRGRWSKSVANRRRRLCQPLPLYGRCRLPSPTASTNHAPGAARSVGSDWSVMERSGAPLPRRGGGVNRPRSRSHLPRCVELLHPDHRDGTRAQAKMCFRAASLMASTAGCLIFRSTEIA